MFNLTKYQVVKAKCLEKSAQLVAVSKTRSVEELKELYSSGARAFGENRVQELLEKRKHLAQDIEWHLIGHLQSNKVKYIADFIHLIHSVDSIRLLVEIQKEAKKNDRVIAVLLQVHLAQEESKFGIKENELEDFMQNLLKLDLSHVQIQGMMTMASFTDDKEQIRSEFKKGKQLFTRIRTKYFAMDSAFNILSMGMSGDYEIALEEGSTMIRVGSLLFD
ncbi:MAG: YggS family pyridoxal phosphate-dependent enzyme [Chitinophagales bacterium]|nr:YggS family pyridoxal phosphate-dependent enzyme [Chitinophagales bacterium]